MANTQFHVQLKADTEFWFGGEGVILVTKQKKEN